MILRSMSTAEEVYEIVLQLPPKERIRLVEMIAKGLLSGPEQAPFEWSQLAGAVPGLLEGVDAQESVSQSRHGSDDVRERALHRGL